MELLSPRFSSSWNPFISFSMSATKTGYFMRVLPIRRFMPASPWMFADSSVVVHNGSCQHIRPKNGFRCDRIQKQHSRNHPHINFLTYATRAFLFGAFRTPVDDRVFSRFYVPSTSLQPDAPWSLARFSIPGSVLPVGHSRSSEIGPGSDTSSWRPRTLMPVQPPDSPSSTACLVGQGELCALRNYADSRSAVGSNPSTVSGIQGHHHLALLAKVSAEGQPQPQLIIGPWCVPIKPLRFHPEPPQFHNLPAWHLVSPSWRYSRFHNINFKFDFGFQVR